MGNKMSLRTVSAVCSKLMNEKSMHLDNAKFYNRLFNEEAPTLCSEVARVDYTKLQRFYQLCAERHMCAVLVIDARVTELERLTNSELFFAE